MRVIIIILALISFQWRNRGAKHKGLMKRRIIQVKFNQVISKVIKKSKRDSQY